MGIEIYEDKVKNRKAEKKEQTKSPKESKEEKEREQAVLETVRLCAEYHEKLDVSGYFNSKAAKIAEALLLEFKKINIKLLPVSLKNVLTHRMAYLNMMTELNNNRKILDLMDKAEPTLFGNLGLFDKDFNTVKAHFEKLPEFKSLTRNDFKKAYSIVVKGIGQLQAVAKDNSNWESDAKKYLQSRKLKYTDKRVDDANASKNLLSGLQIAAKNLRLLEIQKSR